MSQFRDRSGASAYLDDESIHVFAQAWVGMGLTEVSLVASIDRADCNMLSRLGEALKSALKSFIDRIDPEDLRSRCTHTVQSVLGVSGNRLNEALRRVGSAYIGFDERYPRLSVGGWVNGPRGSATPLLEDELGLPVEVSDQELGGVMLDVLERSLAATLELAAAPPKPKRTRAKKAASE